MFVVATRLIFKFEVRTKCWGLNRASPTSPLFLEWPPPMPPHLRPGFVGYLLRSGGIRSTVRLNKFTAPLAITIGSRCLKTSMWIRVWSNKVAFHKCCLARTENFNLRNNIRLFCSHEQTSIVWNKITRSLIVHSCKFVFFLPFLSAFTLTYLFIFWRCSKTICDGGVDGAQKLQVIVSLTAKFTFRQINITSNFYQRFLKLNYSPVHEVCAISRARHF